LCASKALAKQTLLLLKAKICEILTLLKRLLPSL
jgi:hypothetical protein